MALSVMLNSQRLILKAEIKARSGYSLNHTQQIEVNILYKVLDEIDRQIKEIKETGSLKFD